MGLGYSTAQLLEVKEEPLVEGLLKNKSKISLHFLLFTLSFRIIRYYSEISIKHGKTIQCISNIDYPMGIVAA